MSDREVSGVVQWLDLPAKALRTEYQDLIFNRPQAEQKASKKSGFPLKTEYLNHILTAPHCSG